MGDAGLRRDAFGDQAVCDAARSSVERGVGRGAALVHDRRELRALGGMDAYDVGEACDLDRHARFPIPFGSDFDHLIA